MECEKCKTEIDVNSNFCGKCGQKVKEPRPSMEEGLKVSARFWFIAGVFKGLSNNKKEDPYAASFEKLLEKGDSTIYSEYQEVVAYWKEEIKKLLNEDVKQ